MELQEIIKELKYVCDQEGLIVMPSVILEQAIKIMISENINQSRKEEKESKSAPNSATPKQIFALKKIGKYKEGLSKEEASQIIKESREY